MQKKNSKLESFLLKSLPEEKYERIRGYESCIVVSERENKSFKYVVLGDEWLYLTENPPKTIQEAVCLGEVVSVELVNDFPDFLIGDDKRNSQHLAITHWTTEPVKRRSFRKKKSPRGSLSDLHGDRSNASTPLSYVSSQEVWSEDHGYSSLSSLQYSSRPDSRGSVTSARDLVRKTKKSKSKPSKLHTIQSESEDMFLKSLKEELEEDILEDLENQSEIGVDSMSKSMDVRNIKKSARSTRTVQSARSTKSAKSGRPLPVSPTPKSKVFHASTHDKQGPTIVSSRDLPAKPDHAQDDDDEDEDGTCFKCCSFNIGKSKVSPFCGSGKTVPPGDKKRLFSASEISNKPMSDVHIEITSVTDEIYPHRHRKSSINSSITTLRGGQISRAGTPSQDDFERRSVLSIASVSDFGGSMNRLSLMSSDGGIPERRRVVLNLYLLSKESPMLMLIRSAWSNMLLSSTLLMNPATVETPKGSVMRSSQIQRGKTELLFQDLKRDILKPNNDMVQLFDLLNELKVATEKNFGLKKLFWRNSELVHFFVRQLQQYLPKSATSDKDKRSDEFEFVTLLVDILCLTFHESEIIPERTLALKAERGKSVVALLMVLTCTPDFPDVKTTSDTEILLHDFTKIAIATVFELFLMAKQANWGYSEGNFYNISWMVTTMEDIKHTEKFVARVVTMVMDMISPSSADKLSPEEAVLLYHMFFILETFLKYSRRIKTFICNTYMEEFKYFVQPHVLMKKVPQNYPIYSIIMLMIEDVLKKVLPQPSATKDRK